MLAILYSIVWIIASFKLADWKNWRLYYPTILFSVVGDLLYEFISYNYPMWKMLENGLPYKAIPILLLALIGMPLSTFIYLSNYPEKSSFWKKGLYVSLFVIVFVILEYFSVKFGAISYHNDWNLGWSTLFVIVMFIIMRIHYRNPAIALTLSIVFSLTLAAIFNLSFDKMK
ncbi:hypothetical protein LCL95_07055 [Bacillus timonensis]|nr:hypothetical protein [Bacillus timonensis]